MSTTTVSPQTYATIEGAKQFAEMSKGRFLQVFSFVPEDKLHFSPSRTSKSAFQIAAHCAVSNNFFALILRRDQVPFASAPELFAFADAEAAKLTTVSDVIGALEASHAEVIKALERLSDEDVASNVETPVLSAPMTFFMNLPGIHYVDHEGQVSYLQTVWGDLDPHFG